MRMVGRMATAALAVMSAGVAGMASAADASAVVFMYHRFAQTTHPETNIRLEQFEAHIKELQEGGHSVLPIQDIIDGIDGKKPLPDRAVGLTVDDGYRSIYEVAWPRWKQAGFPATIFISTQPIDEGYANFMTWDMIRELKADGVTIGGHTVSHAHMADLTPEEVVAELDQSAARFRAELGEVPTIFAFPYGEASKAVQGAVKKAGYTAAFGQHSGAIGVDTDRYYMPRFALNERYGAMDRFRLAADSVGLRATDIAPSDMLLDRNPPAFGFTLAEPVRGLACYPNAGKATLTDLAGVRIEVRFDGPVETRRLRINCTARRADGRWYWFGMQYLVPRG